MMLVPSFRLVRWLCGLLALGDLFWAIDGPPCYSVEGRYPQEAVEKTSREKGLFDAPCGRKTKFVGEWGYEFHHGEQFPGPCQNLTEFGHASPSSSRWESLSRLQTFFECVSDRLEVEEAGRSFLSLREEKQRKVIVSPHEPLVVSVEVESFLQTKEWAHAVRRQENQKEKEAQKREGKGQVVQSDGSVSLIGHYFYTHYGCLWRDCAVVATEVGENINSVNVHLAFARGAARQFGKPWAVDFSPWYMGKVLDFTEEGKSMWGEAGSPSGVGGHSLSLFKRAYWATFMAGAELLIAEAGGVNWFLPGPSEEETEGKEDFLELSSLGEIGREFASTTRKSVLGGRGIPFVPVAVLLEQQHGMGLGWWKEGKSFDLFNLTEAERSVSLLFESIWPPDSFLREPPPSEEHDERKFMQGSRFGEIFDILTPQGLKSNDILKAYRVLVLAGDFEFPPESSLDSQELLQLLREFVSDGGVLIVDALSAPSWLLEVEEFIGASVQRDPETCVKLSASRLKGGREEAKTIREMEVPQDVEVFDVGSLKTQTRPLISVEGTVIGGEGSASSRLSVEHPVVLLNSPSDHPTDSLSPLRGSVVTLLSCSTEDSRKLSLWESVLQMVLEEAQLLPFDVLDSESGASVVGSVQMMVNVHPEGFGVALVNNEGVTKDPGAAAVEDLGKAREVLLRMKEGARRGRGIKAALAVREDGKTLQLADDKWSIQVEVPAGDVVILQIDL
uniref:Beta-galactosidase trimerisation domain-containing protein n=1 Tax=Chromera velia CCMP2878 TaxID=1169474 RepID=A0A0G4HBR0_9ALVE|eukprot:Cvel_6168.t1-p1 / transcript=Cvel_6168.t1 / gene=Cvel_6168 / organism=Chromera_velia_CCMP2878 / gene_product=hypothetical protein / transcript_product=hypothetical protein / location=Cvel_scaffold298:85450-87771(-) / protein_length=729 / sequence_SO=supercontig / SO=protein_coding / is_pseudo=false